MKIVCTTRTAVLAVRAAVFVTRVAAAVFVHVLAGSFVIWHELTSSELCLLRATCRNSGGLFLYSVCLA